MANEFKNFQTREKVKVEARQLTEDEYFDNRLANKGGYVVRLCGADYFFEQNLFELVFERKYANLQEFIVESQEKYDDETMEKLLNVIAVFEAEKEN
jgi:hypothetical protein